MGRIIMRNMPRLISLAVMLVLIIALGIMFFKVVAPFLLPMFLAGMTAVVCQPVYRYFLKRCHDRVSLAAGTTTIALMGALMLPLIVGTLIASLQLYTFASSISDNQKWQETYNTVTSKAGEKSTSLFVEAVEFGNRFLPPEQRRKPEAVSEELRSRIKQSLKEIGDRSLGVAAGTTFGVLAGTAGLVLTFTIALMIYAVALYYFLADGTKLLKAAETLIPVHSHYQRELLDQFARVVRSVVLATFCAAVGQGLATTAALWFFGFHHLLVLLVLATFSALIPLAGTWLVWMPCAVYLAVTGHVGSAVVLSLYGLLFVGFLDNVIRTYVLNTDTKLHPLLAFISVLGGIQAMGLWGVFIGPIVASCLHALIKIFNHELMQFSRERSQNESDPSATVSGIPEASVPNLAPASGPSAGRPAEEPCPPAADNSSSQPTANYKQRKNRSRKRRK